MSISRGNRRLTSSSHERTPRGSERHDRAVVDVDARGAPVLVAVALLPEDDVPIRVRPLEEGADRAIGYAGQGPSPFQIADGRHPEVAHAVDRGDVRHPRAVEREL